MDFRKYIGVPYKHLGRSIKGTDCYGLVTLIYKDHLDIRLPDVNEYVFGENAAEYMTSFYTDEKYETITGFHELWTPVSEVQEYDVILFRVYEELEAPTHAGVFIGDGKFIHCMLGLPVTINRIDKWKKYMHSAYRYKERELRG